MVAVNAKNNPDFSKKMPLAAVATRGFVCQPILVITGRGCTKACLGTDILIFKCFDFFASTDARI